MPAIKTLDLTQPLPAIFSGHLQLGGSRPQGKTIGFTNLYMTRDGQPCIPVMGEFHFSRYPHADWEDELLKIKTGGINLVATYVFWNHIEEEEGVFDWSDDNDLHKFVALCARHELDVIARIGPFCHGECRNGGLPDWLYGRPFEVRSNDERYLAYVRRLYQQTSAQLAGLLFKDGGPVIGIQLENEYMHCGAPWEVTFRQGTQWVPSGSGGVEHMRILKQIALEAGLEVPIYTCTGWVNSPVPEDEILPMQGGYAFTPWVPDPDYQQPPTREFLFRDRRLNPLANGLPAYDPTHYPFACCELGGGIQITYYHRPVVPPAAVEGMVVTALGDGANLLGYYIFHGGSNPANKRTSMNEFTVPRRSYDFQAPIREFGQIAASYRALRPIHLFLLDFGDQLAPMTTILPGDAAALAPENNTDLRWAARTRDGSGFLFFCNYQDHIEMHDLDGIHIQLKLPGETIHLPRQGGLNLKKDTSAILPFNLRLDGLLVSYATTQLFTHIGQDYFFFALPGTPAEYCFDPSTYTALQVENGEVVIEGERAYVSVQPGASCVVTAVMPEGAPLRIITLTRQQAENCWKQVLWGQERLLMSGTPFIVKDDQLQVFCQEKNAQLSIFPGPGGRLVTSNGIYSGTPHGIFICYALEFPERKVQLKIDRINSARWSVNLPPDAFQNASEIFLRVEYLGDIGEAYLGGKLVCDNFYNGTPWEIGLKRFTSRLASQELLLLVQPLKRTSSVTRYIPTGMTFKPESDGEEVAEIKSVSATVEQRIIIKPEGWQSPML
jgi:hypothetical protein